MSTISKNTMSAATIRQQNLGDSTPHRTQTLGVKALLVWFRQASVRAAARRERRLKANNIYLCSERVKAVFDIPPATILREVGFRGDRFRPLSVAEIAWLYRNPKTADYFEGEIVDAIEAYLAAKREYAQLLGASANGPGYRSAEKNSSERHPLTLHNAKATGDKGKIRQAGITRWIEAGDVIVRVGGGKIDGHAHQVASY